MTQRLPGVAVVAKSGRVQLTTTADAGGCYELKDLPAGSYRVTARLPGFDNVTRDGVKIVPGTVARLDVAMRVSAICECVRLGGTTLAEQWAHADAVLHARLSASESQPATPVGYYRHVATVIDALKKPAAPLKRPVSVLQNQRSAAPGPYDIDQELVIFLRSWGSRVSS
jgi:Carboxypeptidase regulatory-like domain